MEKHIKNLTQEKNSSVSFTFKNTDEFPHFDDSIGSDVLYLSLRGRVLWRRHLSSLFLLWRYSFSVSLSGASVSEDTNNEEIDGKHDDWTLNADHNLLPGELDVTWKENGSTESSSNS